MLQRTSTHAVGLITFAEINAHLDAEDTAAPVGVFRDRGFTVRWLERGAITDD
jgi:hypothetical protein